VAPSKRFRTRGANRIFGFGGWSRETVLLESLHEPALCKDETSPEKDKVVSTFFAKVRITVYAKEGGRSVIREGCGAARGFAKTVGEAMENAIKSAETDAMKRALVTFGDQFGLTLYDKEQRNVGRSETRQIEGREGLLDSGFEVQQPAGLSTSQRALAASHRSNSRMISNVRDVPV
jgi:recombination DNA repair RAD52 pathway protein